MPDDGPSTTRLARPKARLWTEFTSIFVISPIIMAVFLPPNMMFPMLFAVTAIGLALLHVTPTFRWRSVVAGLSRINWAYSLAIWAGVIIISAGVMWVTQRENLFVLIYERPRIMVIIALFYPWVSALPQELLFRTLYFERYRAILPQSLGWAMTLNAAIFSFAHLMYWSWIVAVITFLGGLSFARSYVQHKNFPEAFLNHSIAGIILFAFGMGSYFYSGNVTRPF